MDNGVAVSKEALQALIDQLTIGVAELRAVLLGRDRVPQGLNQLQPLRQEQGQQVIHHRPGRQDRGLRPINRSGGIGASRHQGRRTPTASLGQSSRRVKDRAMRSQKGASLPLRCGRPVGVGFSAVPQMASPASSLSRSALRARDSLVLEHLPLSDAIASVMARRLFPLVEREDLIQVAREALVRSAPRCRDGEPAEPYLRRCIQGALHHPLRDRVRLVRISRCEHEKGTCPLGHHSLDLCPAGEGEES